MKKRVRAIPKILPNLKFKRKENLVRLKREYRKYEECFLCNN
jgi:hypothetical protein